MNESTAAWAICYHSNSHSPRAQKWYYVGRVIKADGQWYLLRRHDRSTWNGRNRAAIREAALAEGLELLHGTFTDAPSPRHGDQMVWSIQA